MGAGAGRGGLWSPYQLSVLEMICLGILGRSYSPRSFSSSDVYQLGFLCKLT